MVWLDCLNIQTELNNAELLERGMAAASNTYWVILVLEQVSSEIVVLVEIIKHCIIDSFSDCCPEVSLGIEDISFMIIEWGYLRNLFNIKLSQENLRFEDIASSESFHVFLSTEGELIGPLERLEVIWHVFINPVHEVWEGMRTVIEERNILTLSFWA